MPYGNYNNNQKQSQVFEPTVYSQYRFNNGSSTIDKTCLTTQYWKNALRISICPRNPDSPDDAPTFDMKNGISVYLNHTKARILYHELCGFMSDPEKYDNHGVDSGSGLITFSTGKEFGSKNPMIIIRKIDENGNISSSFGYEVKGEYHYSVCGFSETNKDFTRKYYPDLELEQLKDVLRTYFESMTYAVAYSVVEQERYEFNRIDRKLNRIGEKLGLDLSAGQSQRSSSTSFFSQSGGSSSNGGSSDDFGNNEYTSATLDDID